MLDAVLVMNIAASEVVIGAALITLFIAANTPLGPITIVIAQVMFSIPFVALTIMVSGRRCGRICSNRRRQCCEGITLTTIAAP